LKKVSERKFKDKPNPVMKGVELPSSDQRKTARCTVRGTTDDEVARPGLTCEP